MATNTAPAGGPAFLTDDYSWFPMRCSIAAIVMSTSAYILRFWARRLQAAPWGWFDWFMVPAYLFTIAISVCGILAAEWGSGRHSQLLYQGSDADFDRWGYLTYIITPFIYVAAITFPRLSILCMFRKIFHDKYSRAGIWLVVAIMLARAVAGVPVIFLQCRHLSDAWHIERVQDNCTTLLQHYTYSRVPNIVADLILLILPIPSLWKLKLAPDVRVGLIATFCLGSFGLITAIVGFVEFYNGQFSLDVTYSNAEQMGWSVLEPAVYFTSACMLTYKPLVRSSARRITGNSILSQYSRNMGEKFTTSPTNNSGNGSVYFPQKNSTVHAAELPRNRSTYYLAEANANVSPVEMASDRSIRFGARPQTAINKDLISAPMLSVPVPVHQKPALRVVPPSDNAKRPSFQSDQTLSPQCGECYGCAYGGKCEEADRALTYHLNA